MEVGFVKRQTWAWFSPLSAANQSYQKTGVSHDTSRLAKNKKTREKSEDHGTQTKWVKYKEYKRTGRGEEGMVEEPEIYCERRRRDEGGWEREKAWTEPDVESGSVFPLCLGAVVYNEQVPQGVSRIQTRSDRKTSPSQLPPLLSPLTPLLCALSPSLSCL